MDLTPVITVVCDFGRGPAEWHVGLSLAAGDPDIKSVMTSQIASAAGKELVDDLTKPELDRIRAAIDPYLPRSMQLGN